MAGNFGSAILFSRATNFCQFLAILVNFLELIMFDDSGGRRNEVNLTLTLKSLSAMFVLADGNVRGN